MKEQREGTEVRPAVPPASQPPDLGFVKGVSISVVPYSFCSVWSVSWNKDASFELPLSELVSRDGVGAL